MLHHLAVEVHQRIIAVKGSSKVIAHKISPFSPLIYYLGWLASCVPDCLESYPYLGGDRFK